MPTKIKQPAARVKFFFFLLIFCLPIGIGIIIIIIIIIKILKLYWLHSNSYLQVIPIPKIKI